MSDKQDAGAREGSATDGVEGIHNVLKEQHRQNMDLQERLAQIEQQMKEKSP